MTIERLTTEYLHTGQPRPYADSYTLCRLTFERTGYKTGSDPKQLLPMSISEATACLAVNRYGFKFLSMPKKEDRKHGLDPYLEYFRPVDPDEKGCSHIWEYKTVTPFCD